MPFEGLPKGIHQRHLGRDCVVFQRVLRMYLQQSTGHAVGQALRNHFEISSDDFAGLYNLRASKLQNLIFSADGIRTSRNYEKDVERYRKRKIPRLTWPWENL